MGDVERTTWKAGVTAARTILNLAQPLTPYRSLKDALKDLELENEKRSIKGQEGVHVPFSKPLKVSHINTKEKAAVDFFLNLHSSPPSPDKFARVYDISPLGLPEDAIIYRRRRKEVRLQGEE
jgi:hypothetical protein